MDAGSLWIRLLAWALGRTWLGLRRTWDAFGGANLLLNLMSLCVTICCLLLVSWTLTQASSPMREAEVVQVLPETRIIDRADQSEFTISRRICMTRGAWGNVTRMFIDADGQGLEFKLVSSPPIFLPEGCHERRRVMQIPASLPPGKYIYRSSIEFCGRVWPGCQETWVQDVPLTVTGPWPAHVLATPPGPIRDPL